jgi:osmotically-inducible protein OsmY
VRPAQLREDGTISTVLCEALLHEPVFRRFSINLWRKEEMRMIRDVLTHREGHLDLVVDEGVVTLSGEVWSLSHGRMAELIAWWTPGVRGVVNRIAIVPDEQDNDDEITDAVRLALDKDPLVQSEQIRITTRDQVVILEGLVRGSEERQMAELDVWYVASAVAGVSNQIQVKRS